MGALTPTELLTAWKQDEVTVEMTLGHLVQNLVKQQTAIAALTPLLGKLRADVDRLLVLTTPQTTAGGKHNDCKKQRIG